MIAGRVFTQQILDREQFTTLEVPVLVTDGGARSHFSTVLLTVSDVNDNKPEFHFGEYHTCIPGNLSVDSVFLKVTLGNLSLSSWNGLKGFSCYLSFLLALFLNCFIGIRDENPLILLPYVKKRVIVKIEKSIMLHELVVLFVRRLLQLP